MVETSQNYCARALINMAKPSIKEGSESFFLTELDHVTGGIGKNGKLSGKLNNLDKKTMKMQVDKELEITRENY